MMVLFLGIFIIHIGLPGTILIFLDAFAFAVWTGFKPIGFAVLFSLFLLLVVAEGGDFWLTSIGLQKSPSFSLRQGFLVLAGAAGGAFFLSGPLQGLGLFSGFYLGGLLSSFIVKSLQDMGLKPAFRSGRKDILLSTAQTALRGFFALVMTVITLSTIYA